MKTSPKWITSLEPHQVFVFGSNEQGFHGAGTAGYAQRGTADNTWRTDPQFLKAKDSPEGSPDRVGKWAVYGIGRGYMVGHEGQSYAIATVTRAGHRRSQSLHNILAQFKELGRFAVEHPELEFLLTISGGGYNGWSVSEIQRVYDAWLQTKTIPENILLPPDYHEVGCKNA